MRTNLNVRRGKLFPGRPDTVLLDCYQLPNMRHGQTRIPAAAAAVTKRILCSLARNNRTDRTT